MCHPTQGGVDGYAGLPSNFDDFDDDAELNGLAKPGYQVYNSQPSSAVQDEYGGTTSTDINEFSGTYGGTSTGRVPTPELEL